MQAINSVACKFLEQRVITDMNEKLPDTAPYEVIQDLPRYVVTSDVRW